MQNLKHLIPLISSLCFTQLLIHKDDKPDILFDPAIPNTLSYLEGEPITEQQAKDYITNWVKESLNQHGKVICYTCKDNALITIEDLIDNPPTQEDLDYLASEQTIPTELEGIFYYSFD